MSNCLQSKPTGEVTLSNDCLNVQSTEVLLELTILVVQQSVKVAAQRKQVVQQGEVYFKRYCGLCNSRFSMIIFHLIVITVTSCCLLLTKSYFQKDDSSQKRERKREQGKRESTTLTQRNTDTHTTLKAHTADGSSERVMIEWVCACWRESACVKQRELMIEFVVVVSKEPEAVITLLLNHLWK